MADAIAPPVRKASAIVSDEALGARPNPDLAEHDERGWRNPVALEQADIVAIGDSQTYGTSVRSDEAWPPRLGEKTGLRTYSISCGGYGPAHYLMLVEQALELRPELLVVGFYAGNDLADAYRVVYDEGKLPELRVGPGPNSGPLLPDVEEVWRRTQIAATGRPPKAPGRSTVDALTERCKLFALARKVHGSLKAKTSEADWNEIRERAAGVERDILLPHSEGGVQSLLTPALRFTVMDLSDGRIAAGLRASWEAFRRIRNRAAPRTRVLVLLIPTKELVLAESAADRPPSLRNLVETETEIWRRTRAYLGRQDIPWVDGLVALRGAVALGENPYFRDHNGHPNPIGQDALAAAVAASDEVRRLRKP